jgi:peptide/nickel transport system substrate-binding protein
LRIFKEELYLITSNRATGVEVWRSSDGASWSQVGGDGFGDPNNIVGYPIVGGNYLYVATRNKVTGVKVFRSSDGASWSQINENGFGDLNNKLPWLRFIFKNHLYVATLNEVTGVEVWRLDELVLQPDFQLNASPSSLTVGRGGSQTSTINVLSLNSFSSPVELSYSWFGGAPSDVAVNLPGPVTPPPDDAGTSTLQVSAGGAATIGTFTLRVTGTSGAISHSMDVSVEITEAATTTAETTTTEATTTTTTGTTATTETSGTVTTPTPTITPLVPGCIIATAAYGSELSGEVQFLRSFRDDKVMGTFAGSAFMKAFNAFYYSFSPQVARFISGSPTLRALTRILLYPLMGALHLSSTVFNALSFTPELAVVAAGFTVSTLLGAFYLFPIAAIMLVVAKRKGCTIKTGGVWWITLAGLISLSALAIGGAVEHVGITMFSSSLFVVSTIATTGIALATRAVKRL